MQLKFVRYLCFITCFLILWGQLANAQNFMSSTGTNTWERIGPGGGGATFLPTFSYDDPSKFIVRCDMTGSYFSTSQGNSYSQFNFDNGANSYCFDPLN